MSRLSVAVSDKDHIQGPEDAPVTLVEYGDYQCPSCGEAYPVIKRLQQHFGDQLRFVFRNFPLSQHPFAEPAAEAAEYAASQDKFWPMHDGLYKRQQELGEELFAKLAEELGLSSRDLADAVASRQARARIQSDIKSGESSGLAGTPTFYINGLKHNGAYDYNSLRSVIETKARE